MFLFHHTHRDVPLLWLGVGSGVLYGALTRLSYAFVYGHGHLQRPILLCVAVYAGIFVCYCLAVSLLLRCPGHQAAGRTVWLIVGFGLLFRATLFFSQPIQEDDFYRYLWDGAVVAEGLNPYQFAPLSVRQPPQTAEPALRAFVELAEQDARLSFVLARVNHPHIPTIYPPLAQAVFGLTAWIVPGSLSALRLVFVACELGLCGVLLVLLRHLTLSPLLLVIYAWSPLVIKETMNSTHYDVLPTFCLVLAVALMVKGRGVLAQLSLAAAALAKLYPALLLPVFFARVWKVHGRAHALLGLSAAGAALIAGYAPFWQVGGGLWTGTRTFAGQWQANSLIFPGLVALVGERWLANGLVLAGLGCAVLLVSTRSKLEDDRQFVDSCGLLLGVLFLLSPVGNPWYFVCLVPFLTLLPRRSWLLLSGLLCLYYVSFYYLYRGRLETWWHIWLEYVPFYGLLAWEWWRGEYAAAGSWRPATRPRQQRKRSAERRLHLRRTLHGLWPAGVLACLVLGVTGESRAAEPLSRTSPLRIVGEQVQVFGWIFPRGFNAAAGPEAGYHFLVWQDGTSPHALIHTPADDLDFHAALLRLGARPGKPLPLAAWTGRPQHPASHQTVTGSRLTIRVSWPDNPAGLALEQVFARGPLSPYFGGNRDRWFNRIPFAPRPGCLVCLYSCPSGKVSNGALSIADYMSSPTRFTADTGRLPPDGTPVVVSFALES